MSVFRKGAPRRKTLRWVALAALAVGLFAAIPGLSASLPLSNFEIDDPGGAVGANLKVDGPDPPALDWANVNQLQQQDQPTGQNDDSYSGGSKEDDPCPAAGTGSIPNNKSDLSFFGGYKEAGPTATHPGFLHVFWSRVQDPSGTTNLDFEFNKLATDCDGAGPAKNVTRSVGDILIQFDVDRGGAEAHLSRRDWTGTAWSAATPLTATQAIGSINQVLIPAAEADGLGQLTPRTFGEASFDLSQAFDPGTCESFGSAMLKSRSSDSFTSQLKDFIVPLNVNIHNCGQVIIRKQTDPDGETQLFDFDKSFPTDPATANEFQLADGGVQDYGPTVLFGSGLTVSEDLTTLAPGWEFVNADCSAGNVTPTSNTGGVVTFDIDAATDVLDCTFNNRKQEGSIKVLKQSIKGDAPLAGATFSVTGPGGFSTTLTTGADGTDCVDGLDFGSYLVTETAAPGGYAIDNPDAVPVTVGVNSECPAGDPVSTLVFDDTPLTDIAASANSQATGPGATNSNISCVDGNGDDVGNSPQGPAEDPAVAATGLEPGTYICTIVIDP
jgi:hypothetical protein